MALSNALFTVSSILHVIAACSALKRRNTRRTFKEVLLNQPSIFLIDFLADLTHFPRPIGTLLCAKEIDLRPSKNTNLHLFNSSRIFLARARAIGLFAAGV